MLSGLSHFWPPFPAATIIWKFPREVQSPVMAPTSCLKGRASAPLSSCPVVECYISNGGLGPPAIAVWVELICTAQKLCGKLVLGPNSQNPFLLNTSLWLPLYIHQPISGTLMDATSGFLIYMKRHKLVSTLNIYKWLECVIKFRILHDMQCNVYVCLKTVRKKLFLNH